MPSDAALAEIGVQVAELYLEVIHMDAGQVAAAIAGNEVVQ
ncbi:MAG TPA: hypothetical protein VGH54_27275 [Mycobacterium sp.]